MAIRVHALKFLYLLLTEFLRLYMQICLLELRVLPFPCGNEIAQFLVAIYINEMKYLDNSIQSMMIAMHHCRTGGRILRCAYCRSSKWHLLQWHHNYVYLAITQTMMVSSVIMVLMSHKNYDIIFTQLGSEKLGDYTQEKKWCVT